MITAIKESPKRPLGIVLTSIAGMGKTTLLCDAVNDAPDGILFECGETRISDLNRETTPHFAEVLGMGNSPDELANGWAYFKDTILKQLMLEDHGYKVLAFDNLDNLIKNNLDAFVVRNYYNFNYEKANGWGGAKLKEMKDEFALLIKGFQYLQQKGITIIVTTHSQTVNVRNPAVEADYKKWTFDIPAREDYNLRNMLLDWASISLFGTDEIEVDGKRAISSKRVLKTTSNAAWDAKWGIGDIKKFNPGDIDFSYAALKETIKKARG